MSEGNSSKKNTSPPQSPEKSDLTPKKDSGKGKEIGGSSSMSSNRTPESNKEKLPAEEGMVVMDEVSNSPKVVAKGELFTPSRRERPKKLDFFFDSSCYTGSGSKKTTKSNTEQAAKEHVVLQDESMFPSLSRSVEIGSYKKKMCQFWQRNEKCPNGDECRFAHGPQEVRGSRPIPSSDGDKNTQDDAPPSESHNNASPAKSQNDASQSKVALMFGLFPVPRADGDRNVEFTHGEKELRPDPSPVQDRNTQELQVSKSKPGPLSSAHSTPCSVLSQETMETPSPSARPGPSLKLNYASPAKSQNYAAPSKFAHSDQEVRESHSVPRPDLYENMQELKLSKSAFDFFASIYKPMGTCVTCQRYVPELCFTCRKSKQCLGCHFKEYFPCSTYHAPLGGPPPAFKLVDGSLAKSQKDGSPAMSQNIASPAMSQSNASPKLCPTCKEFEPEQCLTCHLSKQCILCHFSSGKPCLTCKAKNCRLCNKRS